MPEQLSPVPLLPNGLPHRSAPAGARLLSVSGEAGRGKSHLLRTLDTGAAQRISLTAPDLFAPLVRALHGSVTTREPHVLHALRAAAPDLPWPAVAAAPDGPAATDAERRDVTEQVLAQTLARLALTGGSLLVTADEMERATPDDVRLLTACWRAACQQNAPLDLAVAGRDDAPDWLSGLKLTAALSPQASVTTHTLGLLDEPGMALLVRNRLGPADERFPGWLQARTGGQPLWAAQLIAHLRAGGALRFESGAWHFMPPPLESLPDTLRGLLEQRWLAGRDQPGAADLLDALAVSRTPLPLSALAAVTGLPGDDVQSLVTRLRGQGLLLVSLAGGQVTVTLAHPSLADLGREHLPHARELEWHARLAEQAPDLHARARHARQAGHPHAGPLTEAALQAARDTHQPALIAEHTQALLSRTDWTAGRDQPLRELLGLAQVHLGQPREAARTLRSIPTPSAEAVDLLSRALLAAGDFEDGLRALDELPTPLPLTAQVTRARLHLHAGRADEALAALDELSERPGAPHALIHLARANHAVLQHDAPRLREAAQAALTHAHGPHERADALNYVALAASWLGDFAAAQGAYEACLTLLRDAGREAAMQAVYGNLVNLHVYAADYPAAQQAAATALALARAGGTRLVEMNATGALGMVQVMLGQEDGLEHLQRWAAHYREHVPAAAPYATLHAASAATIFGRRDVALPLLDLDPNLEDAVRPMGYGPVTLAQTYLALGRPDDARRVLDGAPTYDGDQVGQWHLTLTRALHRLATGDPAAAADLLQASVTDPALSRFPSILAEYQWVLLAARLRQRAPDAELRALGAEVLQFLHRSGGRGHLLLTDQVLASDQADRHAYLRADPPAIRRAFLRTLGHFDLEENGVSQPWRARKVRDLLALLLCASVGTDRPGRTREDLTARLWPDLPEAAATATFRKTLLRLRAALGSAAQVDHGPDGYVLRGLHADLIHFLNALDQRDLVAACAWYDGPFLPSTDLPEVDTLRSALHARWRAAALTLAQEPPLTQAAALLDRLLRDDPFDPDALDLLPLLEPLASAPDVRRLAAQLGAQHQQGLGTPDPRVQALVELTGRAAGDR